jgi:hypothetical protein
LDPSLFCFFTGRRFCRARRFWNHTWILASVRSIESASASLDL